MIEYKMDKAVSAYDENTVLYTISLKTDNEKLAERIQHDVLNFAPSSKTLKITAPDWKEKKHEAD